MNLDGLTRNQDLAIAFTKARGRLVRIAYAVLGSQSEAEDVVSDCWSRLVGADGREPIEDVEAWATVAVARLALDALRSARLRREVYVGSWLPEPDVAPAVNPADQVTFDESISFALLVMLESLTPAERVAWVLHDLFRMPFPEIAVTVGRSPQAVRQLAARARAHVATGTPRFRVGPGEHEATVVAFASASAGGDIQALLAILGPDVVLTSDGGGKVSAARRPVLGADNVSRFLQGVMGRAPAGQHIRRANVNGLSGFIITDSERVVTVVSLTVREGLISRIDLIRNPEKLKHVD